jgi:MFS family permease
LLTRAVSQADLGGGAPTLSRTVRDVLRPYRELLATPGGLRFSSAAFVARLPIAMVGLGIVLLVVAQTGRYGRAGAYSATFAMVNAVAAPLIARLVDRFGQRRVLMPAVPVACAALAAFVALVTAGAPAVVQLSAVVVAALAAPSIGSLVRARWGYVLGPDPRLHTAYAFESVLDELIFVLGPLLVTLLATLLAAQAGLLAAATLLAVGTAALVVHTASEPPASRHADGHPSALRSPGLPAVMTVLLFVGGVFGAVELSTVAFADEAGHRALAGPLLACYAGGSMVSGLVFGGLQRGWPPRRSMVIGSAVMTATVALLPFVGHVPLLAVLLFVAGVGIAPTLISAFSLVERIVPSLAVTEGLTWATTALVVGFSANTWLAGRLVDGPGVPWAFTAGACSGLLALVAGRTAYPRLPA